MTRQERVHMRASWAVAVLVTAIASTMLAPASASPGQGPVRSGTIVGGIFDTGPGQSCGWTPDCAAWLQSGCDPALADVEPALFSSIVDVRSIAGSDAEREFVVRLPEAGTGLGPVVTARLPRRVGVGYILGGLRVQFWTAACQEVELPEPIGDRYYPEYTSARSRRFGIPDGIAWMTVVSDDSTAVHWDLY